MTTEEDRILAMMDKPVKLERLFALLHPGGRPAQRETLHATLLQMREKGTVTFDIKTGRWSRK